MPIDAFRDYTFEEQRKLPLLELFENGIRAEDGKLRPELQGVGVVAMAIQALDNKVPVEMLGRIATTAGQSNLKTIRQHPEDLTEELDKRNHPRIADVMRAGMAACKTEEDYRAFAHWLALVRNMAAIRRDAGKP